MKTSTLLVFKFDGLIINTVELYVNKVWSILAELNPDLVEGIDEEKEEMVNRIITLNWEKSIYSLASLICQEINAMDYATSLAKGLRGLDYSLAGDYRLNKIFSYINKLKNADFMVALFTKRNYSDLDNIAKLVKLDLKLFDYLFIDDCFLGDHGQNFSSLSDWAKCKDLEAVYFGNTKEDLSLQGERIKVIVMPEMPLIDYLVSFFLETRQYSMETAINVVYQ